jgi:hypothetical protein
MWHACWHLSTLTWSLAELNPNPRRVLVYQRRFAQAQAELATLQEICGDTPTAGRALDLAALRTEEWID